jgi:hypothetical protein
MVELKNISGTCFSQMWHRDQTAIDPSRTGYLLLLVSSPNSTTAGSASLRATARVDIDDPFTTIAEAAIVAPGSGHPAMMASRS